MLYSVKQQLDHPRYELAVKNINRITKQIYITATLMKGRYVTILIIVTSSHYHYGFVIIT